MAMEEQDFGTYFLGTHAMLSRTVTRSQWPSSCLSLLVWSVALSDCVYCVYKNLHVPASQSGAPLSTVGYPELPSILMSCSMNK